MYLAICFDQDKHNVIIMNKAVYSANCYSTIFDLNELYG